MKAEASEILRRVRCFDKREKLEIINHLIHEHEATLESISAVLGLRKSTAYKYLRQMLRSGIVTYRKLPGKKGRLVFRIEDPGLSLNRDSIRDLFGAENRRKPLIIFDVDDTLIRRSDIPGQLASAGRNAIREAGIILDEKGIPVSMPPDELFSPEWIFSKYGNSIEWYISAWLNISGVPEGDVRDSLVRKHVKDYYRSIEVTAAKCKPFSDVMPFLEKLKGRVYFAAMSNSSKRTVTESFRSSGILKHFMKGGKPLIVGGDEIPKSRATVEEVLRLSGIGPKNSFLVGDSGGDIKAGRDAGIPPGRTIAVSRGITPSETIRSIRPEVRMISSLNELIPSIF